MAARRAGDRCSRGDDDVQGGKRKQCVEQAQGPAGVEGGMGGAGPSGVGGHKRPRRGSPARAAGQQEATGSDGKQQAWQARGL